MSKSHFLASFNEICLCQFEIKITKSWWDGSSLIFASKRSILSIVLSNSSFLIAALTQKQTVEPIHKAPKDEELVSVISRVCVRVSECRCVCVCACGWVCVGGGVRVCGYVIVKVEKVAKCERVDRFGQNDYHQMTFDKVRLPNSRLTKILFLSLFHSCTNTSKLTHTRTPTRTHLRTPPLPHTSSLQCVHFLWINGRYCQSVGNCRSRKKVKRKRTTASEGKQTSASIVNQENQNWFFFSRCRCSIWKNKTNENELKLKTKHLCLIYITNLKKKSLNANA